MGFKLNTNWQDALQPELGEAARRTSQAMFHRVLSSWAMDLVRLRSSGLDRPGPRAARLHGLWSPPIERTTVRQAA